MAVSFACIAISKQLRSVCAMCIIFVPHINSRTGSCLVYLSCYHISIQPNRLVSCVLFLSPHINTAEQISVLCAFISTVKNQIKLSCSIQTTRFSNKFSIIFRIFIGAANSASGYLELNIFDSCFLLPFRLCFTSGEVWEHTPERRIAASTLRRYFGLRVAIAQADATTATPISFRLHLTQPRSVRASGAL